MQLKLDTINNWRGAHISLADEAEFLLPRLRRFAFAATQNIELADTCIGDALTDVLCDIPTFRRCLREDFRTQLFRLVVSAMSQRLKPTPVQRQDWAYLLTGLEKFRQIDVEHILSTRHAHRPAANSS